MSKRKIPVKQRIDQMLSTGYEDLSRHNGKSNVGRSLYDIFYWQEVCSKATTELKRAWTEAQSGDLIDTDDDLRNNPPGEHIIAESEEFSALITLKSPATRLDQELFMTSICRAYKLQRESVDKIADQCRVANKAPLTKRVIEA